MSNKHSTEIKVGLVTIVSIILCIVGLSLGKGCNVAPNSQIIKMRFPSSSGIQQTAPVFINGVKHGSVITVTNDKGSVLITADIDEVALLNEDATAKISILEITGGKKIEISPGKKPNPFNINNELPGVTGADIADLVNIVGDIGKDAKNLLIQLDSLSKAASSILNDKNFIAQIHNTVSNASKASDDLRNLLDRNKDALQAIISNMKSITIDIKSIVKKDDPKIDSLLLKFDDLLTESKTTISNADTLVNVFKSIAINIQQNDGLVNKLIYDKEFAKKIDTTMQSLRLLIDQLQQYGINANVRLGGRP